MDAADLKYFEEVAQSGGMSRAARKLNTVQSNVTRRIRTLESELNVSLFNRTGRGVSLTPAGEQLLPFAIRVARLIDEAALVEALRAKRLAAAGLDVFAEEPPPADHPLFALDNVVLSPHSASLTEESAMRMSMVAAQNCLDGLDGNLDPSLVVNREILSS